MKLNDAMIEARKRMLDGLICPICKSKFLLTDDGRSAACTGARRHLYDYASSGYLNLAPAHSGGGDDADCARARSEFLSRGYYAPIRDSLVEVISEYAADGTVIDAGCGEGYYTLGIAKSVRSIWGFDLSKPAIGAAAKSAHKEGASSASFGIASVYALPVTDTSADALVSIFAPCAETEFARVIRSGGILVIASAGEKHLLGLKELLYDEAYVNESRRDLPVGAFDLIDTRRVNYEAEILGNGDITSLFAMTPYYYRTSLADKEKLRGVDKLITPIDVDIFVYRRK